MMNYEANRLNTFSNWPASAPVDPIRIAKAGFFYTGVATQVQCFSCGGIISQWNYGDQVMWRHRRLELNCPFVLNPQISGNVPLVLAPQCPTSDPLAVPREEHIQVLDSLRDAGPSPEDEMYKNDPLRLITFSNWDDPSVSREALVSAGFYHAGRGRLRCAWCGGELAPFSRFGSLGLPLEVHRMYFPRCEFAAQLEEEQRNSGVSVSEPDDSTTPHAPFTAPDRAQSSGAVHNQRVLNMGGTWRDLGVVSGGARHPQYASLAGRLATFERWPADRQQAPRMLAEAGFYHTGTDDQVRCFYCDGGLGKWEAGDTPWTEHAHWFPHCGYVLLVKGQEFVDTCRNRLPTHRAFTSASGFSAWRRQPGVNFPITENQVDECMETDITAAALGAGLDAARVRRAIGRRLRATGIPFNTSEALIDAVLDEQLNEEPWHEAGTAPRLARDILAETLRDFAPHTSIIPAWEERDNQSDTTTSSSSPEPVAVQAESQQNAVANPVAITVANPAANPVANPVANPMANPVAEVTTTVGEIQLNDSDQESSTTSTKASTPSEEKKLTLEEENRQLKEARMCKVCMDCEVNVVFLPCGHLVSCSRCGAALDACPLCRAGVRALVRAYLA